ncbi:MAG: hypothetical protein R3B84_10955 [Zavarzinella sp.]
MNREFDSPWKETLENYLPDIFEILFPEAHATFDWSQGYDSLNSELPTLLPDSESGLLRADGLYQLADSDETGGISWVFVHFEVQAQQDAQFPRRMFDYFKRIQDKYGDQVSSYAILADNNPNWRPSSYQYRNRRTRSTFEYDSVKLLDYAHRLDDLTTHRSPVGLVVAASIRSLLTHGNAELRFADKCRLIRQLFERKLADDEVWNIMRLLDWLLKLPDELREEFNELRIELFQEYQMPFVTSFEEIAQEKGMKEGIKLGEERGTNFGRRIGQIQAFEEVLSLPITPAEELLAKPLDELDRMISELKTKVIR